MACALCVTFLLAVLWSVSAEVPEPDVCSCFSESQRCFDVCIPGAHSVFLGEGQERGVHLVQLHAFSKRNGSTITGDGIEDAALRSADEVSQFFEHMESVAGEVQQEMKRAWPWHTELKWRSRQPEIITPAPAHWDDWIPSPIQFAPSYQPGKNGSHHHHHSGRHTNPYQRSYVDLTMIDHWCKDDVVLLIAGSLLLIGFDVALSLTVKAHTFQSHMAILLLTVVFSLVYFCFVRVGHDWHYAEGWLTGYVVEIALSIENMFAVHLIFQAFQVPEEQVEFALTVGIYGALALRLVFIVILERLFTVGYIVDIVVGLVLILSGIMTLEDMEEGGVDDLVLTRFSKWMFGDRLQTTYDPSGRVFVKGPNGERRCTLLFLVVWLIVFVDIMFAVDSVGSKTGHIRNTYLNVSSAVMAVFTLRASFFVIRDAAKTFHTLKYGICLVLILMGCEMLASKWIAIGLGWICLGIAIIFTMSMLLAVIFSKPGEHRKKLEDENETGVAAAPPKKSSAR